MTDINTHYRELGQKSHDILNESLNVERLEIIAKSHSMIFDYNTCIEVIKDRPEYEILRIALREYQMSLFSINIGLYNQAFISLRFFFERTLVAMMFSAKELELRLWQRGERDTYWKEIIDEEKGIFSHSFCRAFFPDLRDESLHYSSMAQKVYRECSEYVHGNFSLQDKIPETLEFNEYLFEEWHKKADTVRRILLFVFCLRYLKFIKQDPLKTIESIVMDEFRHLPAINEVFNL
jgi:hypothetical protein